MKFDYGYNFIRITFKEAEMNDSALTVGADPMLAKFPIIAYCEDTGALYTGAYDDGMVTLAAYGSGSGGGGSDTSGIVFGNITINPDTGVITCDKDLTAITSYINSGKLVILNADGNWFYFNANFTYHYMWTAVQGSSQPGDDIIIDSLVLSKTDGTWTRAATQLSGTDPDA